MWKRKLSSTLLLLLCCFQPLLAQPSDSKWQGLDDQALLQEAASMIEKLKILNEDLKKEASEARKESKELSARLEALKSELAESEKMRIELGTALRSLEESWRSYEEEVGKIVSRKALTGFLVGLLMGWGIALTIEALI